MAATVEEPLRDRLARLALRGSAWAVLGRSIAFALRFGSNLILTRLLMPEAFGLMAIVNSIAQGARMLSDLGVRGSIIQHERGNDPAFLDTAWTTQILRGGAICLGLVAASGTLASFYDAPELRWLVRAVAIAALVDGFTSTAVFTLSRRVAPGRQIARELIGQALGIVAMIAVASAWPSVFALAVGTLVASLCNMATSHFLIAGYRNRLRYEADAGRDLRRYGRWVFVSTAMTFALNQTDRLYLGKLVGPEQLGVYAIALGLAVAVPEIVQVISSSVLLPVYARLRALPLIEQRAEIFRYRARVLAIALTLLCGFAALGPTLVRTVYDARYAEAAPLVALLATASIATIIHMTADRALLARGDSRAQMLVQGAQAGLVLLGMWAGAAWIGGIRGVVTGLIGARTLGYVPLAIALRGTGLWLPKLDLTAYAAAGAVCGGLAWIQLT